MIFRVLGKTLLLIAFVALAYDGTRMLATPGEGLLLTSISAHLTAYAPSLKDTLQQGVVAHAPAFLWAYAIEPLLVLPMSFVCGGLGAALFLLGYRRPLPEISTD